MTIDEAIKHCEEVAEENEEIYEAHCRIYSKEVVEKYPSPPCKKCAEEHRQLAEWLKELKAYRDARAEINQALYDDARGEQNDYERGRKSGIFLCESIISVKLDESRSENPNTCGDAISRQAVLEGLRTCYDTETKEYSDGSQWINYEDAVAEMENLPSVTPQQRTGRWIKTRLDDEPDKICDDCGTYCWKCSTCGCDASGWGNFKYCPNCGAKMEVKE